MVKRMRLPRKFGYLWATLALFLISIVGHWLFAWFAYVNERLSDDKPVVAGEFLIELVASLEKKYPKR